MAVGLKTMASVPSLGFVWIKYLLNSVCLQASCCPEGRDVDLVYFCEYPDKMK
jgi:hypothetical protein